LPGDLVLSPEMRDHHRERHYTDAVTEEAEGQVIEETETDELDAETQALRQLALAQVRQYGDPVLRMRAREVTSFDDDLQRLVTRMRQLMHDARGVGLAATQVGILQRVFVFQKAEDDVVAVVNPTLTELSDETEIEDEGCLSLQGVTMPVERHLRVTLEGKDPEGNAVRYELEGHPARVAQHELDHLDGTLILDRTTDEARKEALATLRPRPILAGV
jgi:peptide deformylase